MGATLRDRGLGQNDTGSALFDVNQMWSSTLTVNPWILFGGVGLLALMMWSVGSKPERARKSAGRKASRERGKKMVEEGVRLQREAGFF